MSEFYGFWINEAKDGYDIVCEFATWQDGMPINVDDVEYALQQYLNPDMKNYRASSYYAGTLGLANAEDYYNNDQAGKTKLTLS